MESSVTAVGWGWSRGGGVVGGGGTRLADHESCRRQFDVVDIITGDHPQQELGGLAAPFRNSGRHSGEGGKKVSADVAAIKSRDREIVGHGKSGTSGNSETGDRHYIVRINDRGRSIGEG